MAPKARKTTRTANLQHEDDSMDVDETLVRFKTEDGKRFTLTKSEASCSNTFRMMLQSASNNSTESIINLPSVDSITFARLAEWCRAHCDDTKDAEFTESGSTRHQPKDVWNKTFFESLSKEEDLYKLMHVSNYLDVRSLFNASCQVIAKRWEGKSVEELRRKYSIENDLTAEEENQIIEEVKKLGMNS